MKARVYKICGRTEWQAACAQGTYAGSTDDARDGFIHLSTAEQLAGTLEKHFAGQDDLLLIAFDTRTLEPALKWEPSRGGALFPHAYAPLQVTDAISAKPIPRDESGRHVLPEEVA